VGLHHGGYEGERYFSFGGDGLWNSTESVYGGLFYDGGYFLSEAFLEVGDFKRGWRRCCCCVGGVGGL